MIFLNTNISNNTNNSVHMDIFLNTNNTNLTNIFSTRISRIYNSPFAIARSADSCYS